MDAVSGAYEPIAKLSDKRGLALLEELIEEIGAHEFATWDQGQWLGRVDQHGDQVTLWREDLRPDVQETLVPAFDCGTVACLFGHAVFKAGARMIVGRSGRISSETVLVNGTEVNIVDDAQALLQLPHDLASWLSNAAREWAEIVEFRDAWRADAAVDASYVENRLALIQRRNPW
jgi:hypothetical protein